ncbi:hypothetical protein [Rhizohabitans arisaemae]|uniref:hypothetical protein n=1 Tax=Rhizohabitans arisaemae TaxID=2720610 RepID=UPI0024B047DC|nr:hypothetical protein [Rhizohabitans arisaemae]
MSDAESPRPLIHGPVEVTMANRGKPARPGQALVFSRADRRAVEVLRRPSALGSLKYTYRYEVDITDKRLMLQEPLPSATNAFWFQAELEAQWRVADPEEVVRRGIATADDGDALVRTALIELLRPYCRAFDVDDHARAEESARQAFGRTPLAMPEGLVVIAVSVRVYPDADTGNHQHGIRDAEREEIVRAREHRAAMAAVGSEYDVRMQAERRQQELLALRMRALAEAARGEGGLLLRLLAQEPERLHTVIRELAESRELALERKLGLFRELVAGNLVQPADLDGLVRNLLGQPSALSAFGPSHPASATPGALPAGESPFPPPDPAPPPRRTDSREAPKERGPYGHGERPPETGEPEDLRGDGVTGWRPVGRNRGGDRTERE